MPYVDGFVLPLPTRNIKAYQRVSKKAGKIWRELGAIEYRECVGDDMRAEGCLPFPKLVKTKPGQTIVFSWIVYKSRADRNRIVAKIMKEPRIANMMGGKSMPFDVKRMAYGGFKILVDL